MRATITGIKEQKSKFGDVFWYVFFKAEDGKSYKSCVYKKFFNFPKWVEVLREGAGTVVDGLNLIKLKTAIVVDADSTPKIVSIPEREK